GGPRCGRHAPARGARASAATADRGTRNIPGTRKRIRHGSILLPARAITTTKRGAPDVLAHPAGPAAPPALPPALPPSRTVPAPAVLAVRARVPRTHPLVRRDR